ncbi:helix-turn-helix domain-containing protein [Paraburkholderia tropica]|uniref:helix-turn-helix domain-containing protein n=1 Tax=Paraburkholderia tropica TaxID=92647 RepID=UPI0038CDB5A2
MTTTVAKASPRPRPEPESASHLKFRLRALREESNYSQEKLAEAAALSRGQIADIERGRGNLRFSTLDQIAAVLAVDVADLLAPPGTPPRGRSHQEYFIRVACNIHRARKAKGLSQEGLAKISGRFRTYVTRLEALHALPTIAGLEALSKPLEVSVLDLLQPVSDEDYEERRKRLEKSQLFRTADTAGDPPPDCE